MAKTPKLAKENGPNNTLVIEPTTDETGAQATARKVLEPHARHAVSASSFAGKMLGNDCEGSGLMDYVGHMQAITDEAKEGDLAIASRLLAAQAVTLDTMFTELARRAALNMGEYIEASERYGRLALKAQANSRTTLEALVKLHQPREQIVKHVQVNEGGQAVVADQFHQNTRGKENEKTRKQCRATGNVAECAALPSQNAQGDGLPITSREGEKAMQDARRD